MARCPFGTECFSEKARARGRAAPMSSSPTTHCWPSTPSPTPPVLPEHELLVVDEAHELVDRVTGVATAELTSAALSVATRRSAPADRTRAEPAPGGGVGHLRLGDPRRHPGPHRPPRRRARHLPDRAARRRARRPRRRSTRRPATRKAAAARAEAIAALAEIADTAARILTSFEPPIADRTDVVWLDHEDNRGDQCGAVLRVAPLSVAGLLRSRLFATVDDSADLGDADRRRLVRRDGGHWGLTGSRRRSHPKWHGPGRRLAVRARQGRNPLRRSASAAAGP